MRSRGKEGRCWEFFLHEREINKKKSSPAVVAHAFNSSTWEVKVGGSL